MSRKKIELGDVFKFQTQVGIFYMHFIFQDEVHDIQGVRILKEMEESTGDLRALVESSELFFIEFALKSAVKSKLVDLVGNVEFDAEEFEFPQYFRCIEARGKEIVGWQIVDRFTFKRVSKKRLSKKESTFSSWGIWTFALLVKKLEEGWTPLNWKLPSSDV